MGEFQLIARYFSSANIAQAKCGQPGDESKDTKNPHLEIGIGDDAAVLSALGSSRLAVSVDTLVESVHFPQNANPELLARRALRVNLSDMAAMGAEPRWLTLALTLSETSELWLEGFSRGLKMDMQQFGCELIGGDTTRGPLNMGIQIMGLVPEGRKPLTRSGAKEGDLLVVTGTLGSAGAALAFDLNRFDPDSNHDFAEPEQSFLKSYWLPEPRVRFALAAADYIHAACDISDGLLADAGHLCEQSALSASVEVAKIPVSSDLLDYDPDARLNALTSGDDYELCLAVSETDFSKLKDIAYANNVSVAVVGQFHQKDECQGLQVIGEDAELLEIENSGYTHF